MQRKRRSHSVRKSQFDVRSVDEITEDDLENIAYRSKDKIWDKEKVRPIRTRRERYPPLRVCHRPFVFCLCRAARVTSADRRLWTLRRSAAVGSVSGPKVSSAGRV